MYLDPLRGAIGLVVRDRDRLTRWLYHGLHSHDPWWLRSRRPLWDLLSSASALAGSAESGKCGPPPGVDPTSMFWAVLNEALRGEGRGVMCYFVRR